MHGGKGEDLTNEDSVKEYEVERVGRMGTNRTGGRVDERILVGKTYDFRTRGCTYLQEAFIDEGRGYGQEMITE